MYLYQVFSFLGTIAIFLAAILISSKKAIKPKVRIWAFTFYIGACIYLGTMGALIPPPVGPDWSMIVQQIFLFFVNCRGIYHADKELSGEKSESMTIDKKKKLIPVLETLRSDSKPPSKRDPFEVIVPPDFWRDILEEDDWDDILGENESLEHDY